MMVLGIVMMIVAAVIITFNLFTIKPDPKPTPTTHQPQLAKSISIESQVYQVCKMYANLDLSGMANLCERVGFQE